MQDLTANELYAQLYDAWVHDWDGEFDFYRDLIGGSQLKSEGVLEVACGTGRITLQLALEGLDITGFDLSPELLEIARGKSRGMPNVHWLPGDMRTFEIGRKFGVVISPGHSFQFMATPDDQVKCLEQIRRHLVPDGILVLHLDNQDLGWLAGLIDTEPVYHSNMVVHPSTGKSYRRSWAWAFEPATQNTTVRVNWEALNENGETVQAWNMDPKRLHCIFPFEMEHLLRRVGFSVEAVYGDFSKNAFTNESPQMIWVARNTA